MFGNFVNKTNSYKNWQSMSSVTTLTEKDVFDFLINAYFGCIDEPIGHAANSAYLDLNRTIEFKGSNSVTDVLKAKLRQKVVVAMKSKIDSLLRKSDINQAVFDNWHKNLCKSIVNTYSENGIPFHYGQAQKWVNMTFKYLSVMQKELTSNVFEYLHVPIDTNIIDAANDEFGIAYPQKRCSRVDEKQYLDYQKKLRDAIKVKTNYCPMLWEFRNWRR